MINSLAHPLSSALQAPIIAEVLRRSLESAGSSPDAILPANVVVKICLKTGATAIAFTGTGTGTCTVSALSDSP